MTRAALLAILIFCVATEPAAAEEFYREDLRIPMTAAGPRGLEALLIRPSGTGPFPLALISHGAPSGANERMAMNPYWLYPQAMEFARRGFAALVVMRRGYGSSDGAYAETSCYCDVRSYLGVAKASSDDLRAAIVAMKSRGDVTPQGMIAVGVSAGGYASVALTTNPPPGLAAVISFAGGRRHSLPADRDFRDDNDEVALIGALRSLGRNSRIPMLWVYAENDSYFGPDLAHRMIAAFRSGGGPAQMIGAPAFGSDGHFLFSAAGISIWTPMVDAFLRERNLGTRELLAAPIPPALTPPPQLSERGRAGFASYLAAVPHKAFAASPKGAYGYRSGLRSAAEAESAALAGCSKNAPDCAPYAIDDDLKGAGSGSP
jgi:dienelactone hydrolase